MARILVVDDSPTVRLFVQSALSPYSHQVDTLTTFVELPIYLRRTPPDLVILDLEMPALSGVGFASFVRANEIKPTAILVYSSLPPAHLARAAQLIRAAGFLSKSANGTELADSVRNVLGEKL